MAIYDLAGRRWRSIPLTVRTGEAQQAGWDGKGDDGRPLRPGTYYYRIPGAGEAMSGRVTLVR
jgi:flagellar hook assembly protein FlgD